MQITHQFKSQIHNHGSHLFTGEEGVAQIVITRDLEGDPLPFKLVYTRDALGAQHDCQQFADGTDGIAIVIQLRDEPLVDQLASTYKKMCGLVQAHQELLEEHQRLREQVATLKENHMINHGAGASSHKPTIQVDAEGMAVLLAKAREAGKVNEWADMAVGFMRQAEAEITRLHKLTNG